MRTRLLSCVSIDSWAPTSPSAVGSRAVRPSAETGFLTVSVLIGRGNTVVELACTWERPVRFRHGVGRRFRVPKTRDVFTTAFTCSKDAASAPVGTFSLEMSRYSQDPERSSLSSLAGRSGSTAVSTQNCGVLGIWHRVAWQ